MVIYNFICSTKLQSLYTENYIHAYINKCCDINFLHINYVILSVYFIDSPSKHFY